MSLDHCVLRFKYDDFARITESTKDTKCSEKKTDSQGNTWRLQLKTEVIEDSDPNNNDTEVELYLQNMGQTAVSVKFSIILRDADGRVHTERIWEQDFQPGSNWGFGQFIKRSEVLDERSNILLQKALHVDVHLQIKSDDELMNPPMSLAEKFLKLLETGEYADVSFKIEDRIIRAHKFLLKVNAPILFGYCGENDDDPPIPINEITPEVFMIILRYIYAEVVPEEEVIMSDCENILDAANRFGLLGLKLFIETSLIKLVDLKSAVKWLCIADAKSCALLKEYAMSFILARTEDMLDSGPALEQLQDSPKLLLEVMKELSKKSNNDHRFDNGKNFSVNQLRKWLHVKGLDIDGTKEMLIARLNLFNKKAED